MTENDRGTRAHRMAPSMLQQSERNERSFQKSVDCRPVSYKLSSCTNGPDEERSSGCLLTSSESRRLGV